MRTLKQKAKKGNKIAAVYVIDGIPQRAVDLGEVFKSGKDTYIAIKDGEKSERSYDFGLMNGVQLQGFYSEDAEAEAPEESTPSEPQAEEATPED